MDILTPAYGRDYKAKKAFIEDLKAGKDFKFISWNRETYGTLKEFIEGGITKINIRFKGLSQVSTIDLSKI